jgi:hypothetical protein
MMRHSIQDDYLCLWDHLQQIPFKAKVATEDGHNSEVNMTVYFPTLQGDFVEHCLQAACQQQGYVIMVTHIATYLSIVFTFFSYKFTFPVIVGAKHVGAAFAPKKTFTFLAAKTLQETQLRLMHYGNTDCLSRGRVTLWVSQTWRRYQLILVPFRVFYCFQHFAF